MSDRNEKLRELVSNVAAAYLSNTHVSPAEIGVVLDQIASRLEAIGDQAQPERRQAAQSPGVERPTEAEVIRSVTPDGIRSFEDGRIYKTLRRHLTAVGLTPTQYCQKWGLPDDYPMVAPNLSAMRSELARSRRLGQTGPALRTSDHRVKTARKGREKHAPG